MNASAGSRCHRLRAGRLHPPVRREDGQSTAGSTSTSPATSRGRARRFKTRRRDDPRRVALADRRARRVRGARRHLHRAGREGRLRATSRRAPARTTACRCGRRTATQLAWLSDASGEYQLMIGDQTGLTKPRAIALPSSRVLLRASRGRRRQAAARRGQSFESLDARRRDRHGDEDRHRHVFNDPGRDLRRGVVAGLALDRVLEEPRQPFARDLRVLARRRQSRCSSPTVSPTRSRRRSTPAASISTSSRAPTTGRAPAGSR